MGLLQLIRSHISPHSFTTSLLRSAGHPFHTLRSTNLPLHIIRPTTGLLTCRSPFSSSTTDNKSVPPNPPNPSDATRTNPNPSHPSNPKPPNSENHPPNSENPKGNTENHPNTENQPKSENHPNTENQPKSENYSSSENPKSKPDSSDGPLTEEEKTHFQQFVESNPRFQSFRRVCEGYAYYQIISSMYRDISNSDQLSQRINEEGLPKSPREFMRVIDGRPKIPFDAKMTELERIILEEFAAIRLEFSDLRSDLEFALQQVADATTCRVRFGKKKIKGLRREKKSEGIKDKGDESDKEGEEKQEKGSEEDSDVDPYPMEVKDPFSDGPGDSYYDTFSGVEQEVNHVSGSQSTI